MPDPHGVVPPDISYGVVPRDLNQIAADLASFMPSTPMELEMLRAHKEFLANPRDAEDLLLALRDPKQEALEEIAENTGNLWADAQARSSEECVLQIKELIERLEAGLPQNVEVAIVVLGAGGETVCRVSTLQYAAPALIVFQGVDFAGVPIVLVQNVGMINYALRIIPRLVPEEPRRHLGFHHIGLPPE